MIAISSNIFQYEWMLPFSLLQPIYFSLLCCSDIYKCAYLFTAIFSWTYSFQIPCVFLLSRLHFSFFSFVPLHIQRIDFIIKWLRLLKRSQEIEYAVHFLFVSLFRIESTIQENDSFCRPNSDLNWLLNWVIKVQCENLFSI